MRLLRLQVIQHLNMPVPFNEQSNKLIVTLKNLWAIVGHLILYYHVKQQDLLNYQRHNLTSLEGHIKV